jgi:glyoxylase-like metal-dependent hydrolase (beta-lactamase superfamily II)
MHEVIAVRYGSLVAPKSVFFHNFHLYEEEDDEVELQFWFWVLRDGEQVVLVDTGCDPAEGERRGDTVTHPVELLAGIGIAPEDVSTVLVSHCHYDHIGNLHHFPGAEVVVPRIELEFWATPFSRRRHFAEYTEPRALEHLFGIRDRVRTIEGEAEPLPGVRSIEVGGHSPGQTMFQVETAGGPVLLTSDAVHFEAEVDDDRPFAVLYDLAGMYRAYDRIRGLAADGATVLAGHDPAVAARFAPLGDEAGAAFSITGKRQRS